MRQLFSNYLKHYYHLTLSTSLLTAATYLYAGANINWKYSFWIGLVTFLMYNYHPVLTLKKSQLFNLLRANIPFIFLIIISGIIGFILMPQGYFPFVFYILSFVVCLLYFRQGILYLGAGRDHYLFKPLMISLVFGILTALMPYLHAGYSVMESCLLTIGRVAFIFVLAIIFDIGQVSEIKLSSENTLPKKIGILNTKIIAVFVLIIAAVTEGYGTWIFLLEFPMYLIFLLTWFLTFVLLFFAGPGRREWFYLLLVDGLMLLPWLLSQI